MSQSETVVIEPYVPDNSLTRAVICDLDGTLALHVGRGPFDYEKCETDKVCKPVWEVLWGLYNKAYEVIYLSGREDICWERTQRWLLEKVCPPGKLYMRKAKDQRKDWIVKLELFNRNIRPFYRVDMVFDDRPQVLRMWRELGICTFQLGDGTEF